MAHPPSAVTFSVSHRNQLIPEADLNTGKGVQAAFPDLRFPLSGAICFDDGDGHSCAIEDTLEYLFFHLTGKGWRELQQTGRLHLAHWEYEGSFTLQIQDGFFTIQDNYLNSNRVFDAALILAGLIDCARRYIAFLEALEGGQDSVTSEIAVLKAGLQQNGH